MKSLSLKCFPLTRFFFYFKENGHVALQLPPYTPQLNPVILILEEMKRRVAEANTSFKHNNVRKHTIHTLENISYEFWWKFEDRR